MLLAAGCAFVDDLGLELVGIAMAAGGAAKPIRPSCLEEIIAALLIAAEPSDERRHIFWQMVRYHRCSSRHFIQLAA